MASIIAVAHSLVTPGSIESITSPHRRGVASTKAYFCRGRLTIFAASWLRCRFRLPHPPSKNAEIRQGLRHLLNPLKQSLIRKRFYYNYS